MKYPQAPLALSLCYYPTIFNESARHCENVVKMLWKYCENAVKMLWKYCENSVKILWKSCENTCALNVLHVTHCKILHIMATDLQFIKNVPKKWRDIDHDWLLSLVRQLFLRLQLICHRGHILSYKGQALRDVIINLRGSSCEVSVTFVLF